VAQEFTFVRHSAWNGSADELNCQYTVTDVEDANAIKAVALVSRMLKQIVLQSPEVALCRGTVIAIKPPCSCFVSFPVLQVVK
jgi:hypothetical protein